MTQEQQIFCRILVSNNGRCHAVGCSYDCPWFNNHVKRGTCTEQNAFKWAKELLNADLVQNLPEHIFNPFNI